MFEEPTLVDGAEPEYFATGNALLRTDLVGSLGPLFDPFFGQLGGEDHHLGLRLSAGGHRIVSRPGRSSTNTFPPSAPSRVGRPAGCCAKADR
ncbi:MAG: hypothetical protein R2710_19280 [Acidimicrobiales bacterium]